MLGRYIAVLARSRDHTVAGCYQVGFDQVIVNLSSGCIRVVGASWAARTEGCYAVVITSICPECISGANGDHARIIARRVDRPIDLLTSSVFAVVACCCNDNYPCVCQPASSPAKRIVSPGLDGWSS